MKKIICWALVVIAHRALATAYILPPPGINVIGKAHLIKAQEKDTLADIAREYSVGYGQLKNANPSVDPWYPGKDTPIVIPTRYILPDTPRQGLVLNLPEMRIYYYSKPKDGERPKVYTYPVGIGRFDWQTPLGKTYVLQKIKNPSWTPPASIKAEHLAKGDPLPDIVPAGPDNPLGSRALRLAIPGYLIHGTNKPYGIGMRVSHGCIRLRKEDIEQLFNLVPTNTPVHIVNQPLKVGRFADSLYMEFHRPLEEYQLSLQDNIANALVSAHGKLTFQQAGISDVTVEHVVREASGLPVIVSQHINAFMKQ